MTELERLMLQALQDIQTSFRNDLEASEQSFNQALIGLSNTFTLQEQRWERELAAFAKTHQNLQHMFTQVSAENARLSEQVNALTGRMDTLTKLLNSLNN